MMHQFSKVGLRNLHAGEIVQRIRDSKRKYLMFGAGRVGLRLMQVFDQDQVVAFIDNKKAGGMLAGKNILSLSEAKAQYPGIQILLSIKDKTIIASLRKQLESEGLSYLTFEDFYLSFLRDCQRDASAYYRRYQSEIDYMIEKHRVVTMPAPFYDKYAEAAFPYQEEEDGLVSFLRHGKKVFMPRGIYVDLSSYIRMLCAEQDPDSPHQYFSEKHFVSPEDTFVDVGGAEAMTSLDVLDRAKRIVIFEADPIWKKALEKTFADARNRVTIVPKYVGTVDDEQTVRIDTYFEGTEENLFFKADIEGAEREFLQGAEKTLSRHGTKISICTYHNLPDAEEFQQFFQSHGYECEVSKGHTFLNGELLKGVLRGRK